MGTFSAALDWLVTADEPEVHLRLIGALERFWHLLGHFAEAGRQFDIALARAGEGHVLTGSCFGVRQWPPTSRGTSTARAP